MKNFFKKVLIIYVAFFLFLMTCLGVCVGIIAYSYRNLILERVENRRSITLHAPSRKVIHIKIKGELLERRPYQGLDFDDGNTYLNDIKIVLQHAAKNDRVEGILLELDHFCTGLADLDKLVYLIDQFKFSGKLVVCHTTFCKAKELYIAAHADYHIIYPYGEVQLLGRTSLRYFLKDLMDEVGFRATVFHSSEGKDGPENLVRGSMSPEAKKNRMEFCVRVDQKLLNGISKGRGMSVEELKMLRKGGGQENLQKEDILASVVKPVGDLAWFSSLEAVTLGLADDIGYLNDAKVFFYDKIEEEDNGLEKNEPVNNDLEKSEPANNNLEKDEAVNNDLGKDIEKNKSVSENEKLENLLIKKSKDQKAEKENLVHQSLKKKRKQPVFIFYMYYKRHYCNGNNKKILKFRQYKSKRSVGVLKLNGEIVIENSQGMDSAKSSEFIAQEETIEKIEKCAGQYDVLFICIDSPGGSAIASDKIRAAIERLRAQGVYVISIMENLCASGGLMLALAADEIWCYDGSIIGSLGVYSVHFEYKAFLEKIKVNVDGVMTDKSADLNLANYRPLTTKEKEVYQKFIKKHYLHFMHVAQRHGKLTHEDVMKFEGGKVFLGPEALSYGVADKIIVDLEKAIAQKMEELYPKESYSVKYCGEKIIPYNILFLIRSFLLKSMLKNTLYLSVQCKNLAKLIDNNCHVRAHCTGYQAKY